jgi:hypothetical protein
MLQESELSNFLNFFDIFLYFYLWVIYALLDLDPEPYSWIRIQPTKMNENECGSMGIHNTEFPPFQYGIIFALLDPDYDSQSGTL